jgi:hypothetical protein
MSHKSCHHHDGWSPDTYVSFMFAELAEGRTYEAVVIVATAVVRALV